jgi:hypothetical protein
VRPTKDVDISMEIASIGEHEKLREDLIRKRFVQKSDDDVICRFHYEDVTIDVMSTMHSMIEVVTMHVPAMILKTSLIFWIIG